MPGFVISSEIETEENKEIFNWNCISKKRLFISRQLENIDPKKAIKKVKGFNSFKEDKVFFII